MAKPKLVEPIINPDIPEYFKSYQIERGKGGWILITATHKMGEVTYETSQPDVRPIIMEAFKIANGKYWGKQ